MNYIRGNVVTLMPLLVGDLLLVGLVVLCGECRADFSATFALQSNSSALAPGSYSSSVMRSSVECAMRSSKLAAPGFGVRQSSQQVDCFVSTTSTLIMETPGSPGDYMTIFKLGKFAD